MYDQYETVIGLEIHVQLSTESKAFCGDDARFGGAPNTHISAISLGHPGTLPRLNERQLAYAVKLGMAMGSHINLENRFDRKNYFYADLPKGYQITQDAMPIAVGGQMDIMVDGRSRTIRLHHIHMEEDAGKSIHDSNAPYSLIDLNRAGVPLLEIVSEPDLRSAEEVDVYMTAVRQLVRYLGISDGNMQEGSMRCDCNISVRKKGETAYGTRCEVKNLNSMRFARKAIAYEVKRQIDILESGGTIVQNTLNFDPVTGRTSPLRTKENANDYRYFPEPDLPPIRLSTAYLEQIRSTMPALPWEVRTQLVETFALSVYDATLISEEKAIADFYIKWAAHTSYHKAAANLLINKIRPWLNEHKKDISDFPLSISTLSAFLALIETKQVSHSAAYQRLFSACLAQPEHTPESLAAQLNLLQSSDANFLIALVDAALDAHPDKVQSYHTKGKKGKGMLGFFMGQVMRASQGKAAPKELQRVLAERLQM
ncbi:MAG: Asp-tRNA(Asn)/Glu-tRNA(Gln) amidotransferase subunit GatB, partial [Bacteroidota bacterium]